MAKHGKVRYAVAGLGWISQIAVLPAFHHARKNSELVALISGDDEKLQRLGKRYGVKNLHHYNELGKCLASGEVDALYIALPNHMHCEYTLAAAKHGVHVLCEKPMALTTAECERMLGACKDAKVKLMVAYRLHFDPANLEAIEIAQSGKLGDLRLFQSIFSNPVEDASNYRLKEYAGGGPLYDLGIYCINAARYLFQDEPLEVTGFSVAGRDARFEEVEESFSGLLHFPEDRLAQFTCSFGASPAAAFELFGTKGSLRLDSAYEVQGPMSLQTTIGEKKRSRRFGKTDQFAPELVYFSDCVIHNRTPETSGVEGLIDVHIINSLLQSAAEKRTVRLDAPTKNKPLDIDQKMKFPPVAKQPLINVDPPAA